MKITMLCYFVSVATSVRLSWRVVAQFADMEKPPEITRAAL